MTRHVAAEEAVNLGDIDRLQCGECEHHEQWGSNADCRVGRCAGDGRHGLFLNGPWSAINGDTGLKTDYTDRMVLITEQTSTCPEL